ncbi:MAG: phosphoribosylamine--glycine ligase, partial [Pyrinomonadaceae bacterium]|nr:phosphoribosylamine--glycine ligase [Pyrinomonadaceae bacterium]
PAARDHKRIGNGDTGPNTGGMGTFTDASLLTAEQIGDIAERILKPTLHGCIREGMRYRGVLFLGLMMTAAGPMLLEYNVRFGDPETQSILVRLETDLVDICGAMLNGSLSSTEIEWRKGSSACVVLAAEGYPGKPRTGDVITGLPDAATMPNVTLFHAATSRNAAGEYCTAGGRVLGVTAVGDTLSNAVSTAYGAAGKIAWQGMQYRSDIGK